MWAQIKTGAPVLTACVRKLIAQKDAAQRMLSAKQTLWRTGVSVSLRAVWHVACAMPKHPHPRPV